MRIRSVCFAVLAVTVIVTFFMRSSLSTVQTIRPEGLAEPLQTPASSTNVIAFTRDGYSYECTPLFDYSISGLVVHTLDYSWFSIDRSEKAFPVDVCMIWGDNLQQKFYQLHAVKFSQDCRFCSVEWDGDVPFRLDQLSNNH